MAKTAVIELLDCPKLISRKIWMIEKSCNFHTVVEIKLSSVYYLAWILKSIRVNRIFFIDVVVYEQKLGDEDDDQ